MNTRNSIPISLLLPLFEPSSGSPGWAILNSAPMKAPAGFRQLTERPAKAPVRAIDTALVFAAALRLRRQGKTCPEILHVGGVETALIV